jgi:serine/threonine protein kinase
MKLCHVPPILVVIIAITSSGCGSENQSRIFDDPDDYPLVREYAARMREVSGEFRKLHIPTLPETCPPDGVRVKGEDLTRDTEPLATGSDTALYKLSDEYLLKVIMVPSPSKSVLDGMINERVIMDIMGPNNPYGVVDAFKISSTQPSVSGHCLSRMLVVSLVAGQALWTEYVGRSGKGEDPIFTQSELFKIAVNSIMAVGKFHMSGFAHGDIHPGNFILDAKQKITLIDLGRANPFIDDISGKHIIQQSPMDVAEFQLSPLVLSPWHISSGLDVHYKSTRRDDMFRIAETMFILSSPDFMMARDASKNLLSFKQNGGLTKDPKIHELFRDFYTYTIHMQHDVRPDYERWIRAFQPHS